MGRMIDADALIDNICKYASPEMVWDRVDIIHKINKMPTIEERKTGAWIIEPYDVQNDIFVHRCGVCMRVAMLGGHTTRFHYCPLCGSFMEGEQP